MDREILVCLARLTWSYPYYVHRGEKFYCVGENELIRVFSNIEDQTMEELAEELHEGWSLSGPLHSQDKINYKPRVPAETFYAGGLFGRRIIPAYVYCFDPLKRRQRKELESHLESLGWKCERINRNKITLKS